MLVDVSITGIRQLSLRAAVAACLSWPVVRGNSPDARRGSTGSAVSSDASSHSSSDRASIRSANRSRNAAISEPLFVRNSAYARCAASSAASTSDHSLTGYSPGSDSPVFGFSAWKVPVALASRHWPPMSTLCIRTTSRLVILLLCRPTVRGAIMDKIYYFVYKVHSIRFSAASRNL